jgi:hypothetical protein
MNSEKGRCNDRFEASTSMAAPGRLSPFGRLPAGRGRRRGKIDPKRTNGRLAVFGDPRLADGYAADRRLPFPADLISGRGGDANPE